MTIFNSYILSLPEGNQQSSRDIMGYCNDHGEVWQLQHAQHAQHAQR